MHTQWKPLTVVVLNNNSHCTTAWSPPAHQASSTPVAIVLTMDDKKCFISEWDLSSFHGGGREGRTRRNQAHFQQFKNKVNSQINTTCSQGNYQKKHAWWNSCSHAHYGEDERAVRNRREGTARMNNSWDFLQWAHSQYFALPKD